MRKFLNGIDLASQQIKNVADGSASTDAVNKGQLDAAVRGLDWKQSVRAASTANVTIAGPGTSIDGVTLANGDRVLLKNQTTGSENGIYEFNGSAAAMTRAPDADVNAEVTSGMSMLVTEGTANGDKQWVLTTNDPIVVGTTSLTFAQLGGGSSSLTEGNGIDIIGDVVSIQLDSNPGLVSGAGGLKADYAVLARKYAVNVGNGSATTIQITHSLNTLDVLVQLVEVSTGATVEADVVRDGVNTVSLTFAVAPTSNQYRAVVTG